MKEVVVFLLVILFGTFVKAEAVVSVPDVRFTIWVVDLDDSFGTGNKNPQFIERIGDKSDYPDGLWESIVYFNNQPYGPGEQFAWINENSVDFILHCDTLTGVFTMTLVGGPTTTWAGHQNDRLNEIWLFLQTSDIFWYAKATNLYLNDFPVGNDLAVNGERIIMQIEGALPRDIFLRGTLTYSWVYGNPKKDQIRSIFSFARPVKNENRVVEYFDLQTAFDDPSIQDGDCIRIIENSNFYGTRYTYNVPGTLINVNPNNSTIHSQMVIEDGTIVINGSGALIIQ